MKRHSPTSGGGPSHPKLKRAGSPEPSCVSMKSDLSMFDPPTLSRGRKELSWVSMKSDQSMREPPTLSRGRKELSWVSMKSDQSMREPPTLSRGRKELSWVSMKSDQSMREPPTLSRGRKELSWVSMKSDRSMRDHPTFRRRRKELSWVSMKSDRSMRDHPTVRRRRKELRWVSMKSDQSMREPATLSRGRKELRWVSMKSDRSMRHHPTFRRRRKELSCVSMKSDRSMRDHPTVRRRRKELRWVSMKSDQSMREPATLSRGRKELRWVSMKSDRSMRHHPTFRRRRKELSCVSMKSDRSMRDHPTFSRGGGEPRSVSVKSDRSMFDPPTFSRGGEPSCVSVKCNGVIDNHPHLSSGAAPSGPGLNWTETALQMVRTGHQQQDSHLARNDLHRTLERHKTSMKNKYDSLFEGIKSEKNRTLLNRVYTQLYIIEGESVGVNEEHEVLQMEKTPRRHLQDSPINCLDIFKPLQAPGGETQEENIRAVEADSLRHREREEDHRPEEQKFRAVLTKGNAGIGKTVSVQKFILDWAEGKANQDVDFMFVLPFRELNLIKDDQYSLHGLLCAFHPELKHLDPEIYDQIKAVFIFDGLDESRIPLNFEQCEKVSDITMTSSVGVLMTNLIKGELLPSALIWITSRPAAANQIPPKYINRVTEIQGFSDPQKEEYFRKRISDEDQAERIISHIKTVRSLHIMCHIPVFCWISATVLQQIMKRRHTEVPKTLTEMYSHFLITQTNKKNEKYEKKDKRDPKNLLKSNTTILLKLAKLAFKQLMKGNVMFYEEDLRESSIDVTEASVYSGIFTEIFREECVLYQRKVYCFVHLSFQEFLAAVYVIHCYENKKNELLWLFKPLNRKWLVNVPLDEVLKGAVYKAVKSESGRLDLFLRFLLGISLESNQRLLQGLLTPTQSSTEETRKYIKKLIKGEQKQYQISTNRSINLFLCLSEMNDQSLSRELQKFLNSEKHSEEKLSPGQCSALACMLLTSEELLNKLDPKKYNTSEEGYRRLVPAVSVCKNAVLAGCNLNKHSCETISSALQAANSSLNVLDLSNNNLQDSGVELLSAGLKNPHCKLKILRLSGCMVTGEGCTALASALKSNPSHLKELDLTYNYPGESGVKLLSDLLEDPHCRLKKLQVDHGGLVRIKPGLKKYTADLTLDPNTVNRNLALSERRRKVEFVGKDQRHPDHPDRFERYAQVLSAESLTGRCYWEAEWSEHGADISVSYRGIRRRGGIDTMFGNNNQSWTLSCFSNRYSVSHSKQKTDLPAHLSPSNRVGVYLDRGAGTLSFYTISPDTHTLTHLHTLTTTFTEPLYAGIRINSGSLYLC
ncbi:NACHT, LRR and PYD domains-containing protein 3-like isoform X2 [Pygocentrus nattereri]|uniref:NACHT, LRR and PYD domains-containing protein 3-like isoform X2 n=1 Tax=Pygocentrus nattereri TaxID=42514 RepID=UPI001890F14D|nr:NACHT, LRR and PYD domains-containing protein 3-like isoform X2 [Pygocentrus nattereri]